MDKKTIYTVISKPIDRYHYILGKFFGLLLTVYIIMIFMTFFFLGVMYYFEFMSDDAIAKALYRQVEGKWVQPSFAAYVLYIIKSILISAMKSMGTLLLVYQPAVTAKIIPVVFYSALELAVITAFAILYSTFTSPTLSAMFTVLTFVIGRMNEDIIRYVWLLEQRGVEAASSLKHHFAVVAAHIAPNLGVFDKRSDLIYKETVIIEPYAILYGIFYTAGVLILAMLIFKRRNLK
jgi:hypothetical protein